MTKEEAFELRQLLLERLYREIKKVCRLSKEDLFSNLKGSKSFEETVNMISRFIDIDDTL
jgi:hypothetical protein